MKQLLARVMGNPATAQQAFLAHVPDGMRVYGVGDIHGRADLLEKLLRQIAADVAEFRGEIQLVFVGDYIDRGPDSARVVDMVMALPKVWNPVFLRGNHEQAMLDFLADPHGRPHWLSWGGTQALESYGIAPFGALGMRDPAALAAELDMVLSTNQQRMFFEQTVLHHVVGNYLFVHAGVRPFVPVANQLVDDLLFIREDFVGRPHGLPFRVVFGHTIVDAPLLAHDRIALDTGAFASGVLSAVALEGTDARLLQAHA